MIAMGINNQSGLETAKGLEAKFSLLMPDFYSGERLSGALSSLLAHGSVNESVQNLAKGLGPYDPKIPMYASVFLTDPFVNFSHLLKEYVGFGIKGISNFPSIGFYDGRFRQDLEATGFNYPAEANKLHQALESGVDVIPFLSSIEELKEVLDTRINNYIFHSGVKKEGGGEQEKNLIDTLDNIAELFQGKHSHSSLFLSGWILEDPALFRDIRRKISCCKGLFEFLPSQMAEDAGGLKTKLRFLTE